ncbi:MAG: hypothetical protein V7L20_05085 [Nostoc sp.]|uniref:hypothetical protein n=1 Tax=Nostoc sp. TaxID=1180 RepID=UPI002FFB6DC7
MTSNNGVLIPPRDDEGKQLPPTSDVTIGRTLTPSTPAITAATPPDDKLPDNFQPFEHLQEVYIPQHNALVRQYFSDHAPDWKPNIATPRSSLRVACTMLDSDNQLIMNLRHHLLFDLLGYSRKNLLVYYGSRESIDPPVEGHPKLVFYFSQDSESVSSTTQDYKADAECSVRLMTLENTSINLHEKLVEIANEIKTQFVHNKQGIIHIKGNLCISYKDVKHGFPNGTKIFSNNETDGISIFQKICNVIDVPFDELKINVGNPKKSSTVGAITETQVIMGKTRKKKAYRRVVNVRFRYAYALVPGEPEPVFLVDTTYRYHPLVKI